MNNLYPNRRWLVIPTSVTNSIDWNQVIEMSPETLRLSIDETETFVKYDVLVITASYSASFIKADTGETGSYIVYAGTYGRPDIYSPAYPEYLYPEILELLSTPFWTNPDTGSIAP